MRPSCGNQSCDTRLHNSQTGFNNDASIWYTPTFCVPQPLYTRLLILSVRSWVCYRYIMLSSAMKLIFGWRVAKSLCTNVSKIWWANRYRCVALLEGMAQYWLGGYTCVTLCEPWSCIKEWHKTPLSKTRINEWSLGSQITQHTLLSREFWLPGLVSIVLQLHDAGIAHLPAITVTSFPLLYLIL